ncbi:MAG: hypothetical protein FJ276_22660 [Planctomycetes bacterium]|nr:hypothetical protein [Planctomycetota bacterium]
MSRTLENREDLWQVLAMLTERRAIAERRRECADKRGGGNNRGESVFEQAGANGSAAPGIDQVVVGCAKLAHDDQTSPRDATASAGTPAPPYARRL